MQASVYTLCIYKLALELRCHAIKSNALNIIYCFTTEIMADTYDFETLTSVQGEASL